MIDTTVLVDVQRGDTAAAAWLRGLTEPPSSSEVVRAEFLRGIRPAERRLAEGLCAGIDWIPVTEVVARRAAEFGRRFRRRRQGIGIGDLIIAATADLLGSTPATHNLEHFPMFAGLRKPY